MPYSGESFVTPGGEYVNGQQRNVWRVAVSRGRVLVAVVSRSCCYKPGERKCGLQPLRTEAQTGVQSRPAGPAVPVAVSAVAVRSSGKNKWQALVGEER